MSATIPDPGPAERALRSDAVPDRTVLLREINSLRIAAGRVRRERDEHVLNLHALMALVRDVHGDGAVGLAIIAERRLRELVKGWDRAKAPTVSG